MTQTARSSTWIALTLVVVGFVAYAAVIIGGATFVGRDHLTHTLPAKQYLATELRHGHLPEWWDAVDMGTPFAANPNHSALYPPAWLVAILPSPWSVDCVLLLHVLLAGLGAAALSRRLGADTHGAVVSGAAFMLSGIVTSTVVHGGPLLTLAWVPWLAWAADRIARADTNRARGQHALMLAALAALQLLAGDPSFVILGALCTFGVIAARAQSRRMSFLAAVIAYLGAVCLAAVAFVPAVLLAKSSARAGGLDYEASVVWSMHPWRLLELFWPSVLGDPNRPTEYIARSIADSSGSLALGPSWALGVYVSMPILILGGIGWARSQRRLGWLVPAFLLLALGGYTPLYRVYRVAFIPEWFVRYPEKYVAGAALVACVLAGVGWTHVRTANGPSKRTKQLSLVALGVFAALVGLGHLVRNQIASAGTTSLSPPLHMQVAIGNALSHGLVALALTAAIGTLVMASRRARLARLELAAIALLALHLASIVWRLLPTFDRDIVRREPALVAGIEPGRILRPSEHLTRPEDPLPAQARTLYEGAVANTAASFGFSYVFGYDQAHSAEFERWRTTLDESRRSSAERWGARYLVVPASSSAGMHVLATDAPFGPYALVDLPSARPRAFLTTSWRWVREPAPEPPSVLDDDLRTIHLSGTGTDSVAAPKLTPCSLTSPDSEHVEIRCDAPAPAFAVLLDSWREGWSATVDGHPARIERADALVRAVAIAKGHHIIRFTYTTPGLRAGAVTSLVSWLAFLALAIIGPLARRQRQVSRRTVN